MLVEGVISFAVQDGWKHCYTSTDINDYGVFEAFDGYSKLDIFPKQLNDNIEVYMYSYYFADTFLDPTAQIYLECSYEEEDYLKEIERLEGIQEDIVFPVEYLPKEYEQKGTGYSIYSSIKMATGMVFIKRK